MKKKRILVLKTEFWSFKGDISTTVSDPRMSDKIINFYKKFFRKNYSELLIQKQLFT